MIALVISIIVMLILAGVSINAVVGDNGVLGKATDAVYLQSAAVLEEYFNQLYAEGVIDGNEEGETPLATIMKNGYQHYFFSTSEGYCLKKNYTNSDTGETQTLVLYLVKKEQLPEEIRKQIKGADNLESRDYRKLNGVYGITSDLRAYYCQSGIDSMLGLTTSDLNADSPDIVAYDENSILAQIINGGTAPITNQGLKTIKTLTIDTAEKLSIISDFSKFTQLQKVYFKSLTIENLNGIEGAANSLVYLNFRNCLVNDYSALNNLINLQQLYVIRPVGLDSEVARFCSVDKGIGNAKLAKLKYFGILGGETSSNNPAHDDYINSSSTAYADIRYEITDISPLSNLTEETRNAIEFMNLQNLQLTSIKVLENFSNIYFLRLENNALTSLEGINNLKNLTYLIAPMQYSSTLSKYTLGINETTVASTTDALSYIYKENETNDKNEIVKVNKKLYYVDLRNNNIMKHVEGLENCNAISFLYLAGCNSILDASSIATVLGNCGKNYSIDGTYGLQIITDNTTVLSLAGKTLTISEFEQLKNKTLLTHLNIDNIKIKDSNGNLLNKTTNPTFNDEINSVLSTCKSLQYLKISNMASLTSIDFVGKNKVTGLIELDVRNTGITDLTNLNTYGLDIKTLLINTSGTDIVGIQDTINRCRISGNYWNGGIRGICIYNWDLIKELEKCTNLTHWYTYPTAPFGTYSENGVTKAYNLDLSKTQLQHANLTFAFCKITFPNTLISLYEDFCASPLFSENSAQVTSIELDDDKGHNSTEEWSTTIQSMANCTNLSSLTFATNLHMNLEDLSYLSNLTKLTKFEYKWWTDQVEERTSLKGVGSLTHLTTLSIYMPKLWDISDLKTCTALTDVTIRDGQVSDISALKNATGMVTLDLHNNRINDIYIISNFKNLNTLNLNNNCLTDFSTHISDEKTVGYEVMDVFYDLNYKKKGALKNLYISGNTFDDTEILLDLPWDEKSGF